MKYSAQKLIREANNIIRNYEKEMADRMQTHDARMHQAARCGDHELFGRLLHAPLYPEVCGLPRKETQR